MVVRIDLTGQRFGKLVVIDRAPSSRRRANWNCLCDCGATRVARTANLRSSRTRSCGCAGSPQEERAAKTIADGVKVCTKCKKLLPISDFAKRSVALNGRQPHCKACSRHLTLKRKYGITSNYYDELLEAQGGCCAICSQPVVEGGKWLAVDHNHANGKVRGLLCDTCNTALGLLNDSYVTVLRAANYLAEHSDSKKATA